MVKFLKIAFVLLVPLMYVAVVIFCVSKVGGVFGKIMITIILIIPITPAFIAWRKQMSPQELLHGKAMKGAGIVMLLSAIVRACDALK